MTTVQIAKFQKKFMKLFFSIITDIVLNVTHKYLLYQIANNKFHIILFDWRLFKFTLRLILSNISIESAEIPRKLTKVSNVDICKNFDFFWELWWLFSSRTLNKRQHEFNVKKLKMLTHPVRILLKCELKQQPQTTPKNWKFQFTMSHQLQLNLSCQTHLHKRHHKRNIRDDRWFVTDVILQCFPTSNSVIFQFTIVVRSRQSDLITVDSRITTAIYELLNFTNCLRINFTRPAIPQCAPRFIGLQANIILVQTGVKCHDELEDWQEDEGERVKIQKTFGFTNCTTTAAEWYRKDQWPQHDHWSCHIFRWVPIVQLQAQIAGCFERIHSDEG